MAGKNYFLKQIFLGSRFDLRVFFTASFYSTMYSQFWDKNRKTFAPGGGGRWRRRETVRSEKKEGRKKGDVGHWKRWGRQDYKILEKTEDGD
jgi:hypothetical protein